MGVVSRRRQPSNSPCTPPIDRNRAEKIFQFEHKIFHQCCQLIDAGFMFHVKHLSMYILEYFVFWHVSCRRAWYLAHVKNDITYFSSTIIAKPSTNLSSCNILILLRIFKFTIFRSSFFASAIFIPKSPKKYFARNPQ